MCALKVGLNVLGKDSQANLKTLHMTKDNKVEVKNQEDVNRPGAEEEEEEADIQNLGSREHLQNGEGNADAVAL